MRTRPVDPRVIKRQRPAVYHVYFWSDRRRVSDEHELTGARGVGEVLAWAEAHAAGREIEILVVADTEAVYLVGPLA